MKILLWRALAVPMTCCLLAGCASLLGGGKPVDQFRFGTVDGPPVPEGPAPAATRFVTLMPIEGAPEIEGDKILSSDSAQARYIKGARWVAPVPILFEQLLRSTFRTRAPSISLGGRRTAAGQILQITLERFEARYAGPGAPPTIVIDGEAILSDSRTRLQLGRYHISETQAASSNRATAIVSAFDAASTASAIKLAAWVDGLPGQ